jgi:phthalate 4,5-cis-dihydrodiol dehydrogenase
MGYFANRMILCTMGKMPAHTLRLGAIGLGRAAATMLPSLIAHPNVRLTAAADLNPEARARFEADFGGRTYPTAAELCASSDVDAVYIATPHQHHAADVLTAAGNGKHAIVEKPMALTLEDCRSMTEAARAAGTALVIGHTHAFDGPTMMMGKLIASGEFGRLRMVVNMVYTNFLYRPRRPEELDTAQGGGIMFNQVPHQLEIMQTLTPARLHSVRAVSGIWDAKRPTEGALAALLTYQDGTVAQLTYSGYDHFDTDELTDWVGESGEQKAPNGHGAARRALRSVANPLAEKQLRINSGYSISGAVRSATPMHEPHFGFLLASCEGADLRPAADGVRIYSDEGVREVPAPPARIYPNKDAVIDELYAAAVLNEPAVHDGVWGTRTMTAAFALLESARESREVVVA